MPRSKGMVFVDIDGVLTLETKGAYSKRTPNRHNIARLSKLKEQGYKIVLWSSRFKRDKKVTLEWLKKYEVPFDELRLGKPRYVAWIDDKAVNICQNCKYKIKELFGE